MRARPSIEKCLFLILAGFLLFFSLNCRKKNAGTGEPSVRLDDPQKQGNIILEVEGAIFTNADFGKYVRHAVGEKSAGLTTAALSRLYDSFVDEKIFLRRAQDQGIVLTEEERKTYMDKLKNVMAAENEKEAPAGGDEDILSARLIVEKYLYIIVKDIKVEDAEVAAYYSRHKSDFLQQEKVQVSQILLATEGKASEVQDRLKNATEEEFRAVARAESAGPEASKGGRMGVFSAGQLPSEFEKFIFPMKEGEISRVVESSYGYHIFRLDKKIDARLMTLDEAEPSIRAKILSEKKEQAVAAHLDDLKATLDWKSLAENLPFAYQRTES
jgi:parvulin-like peptidyl-prolyl isomerase